MPDKESSLIVSCHCVTHTFLSLPGSSSGAFLFLFLFTQFPGRSLGIVCQISLLCLQGFRHSVALIAFYCYYLSLVCLALLV